MEAIPKGRRSDWDELGFAGWSHRIFRCQTAEDRPPERLPEGKRMHGGMSWGAVARKRTTATGLAEKTISDQREKSSALSETGYRRVPDADVQNEAQGFGEGRAFLAGTTKQETTGKTT